MYSFSSLRLTNFDVLSTGQAPVTAVLRYDPNIISHDRILSFDQVEPIVADDLGISSEIFTRVPRRKSMSLTRLSGTVYDANGAVIIGASITAIDGDNRVFKTKTNENGVYELELPFSEYDTSTTGFNSSEFKIAAYEISAEAPQFVKSTVRNYKVVPSYRKSMQLDFALDTQGPDPCHDPTACTPADPIEIETEEIVCGEIIQRKFLVPQKPL